MALLGGSLFLVKPVCFLKRRSAWTLEMHGRSLLGSTLFARFLGEAPALAILKEAFLFSGLAGASSRSLDSFKSLMNLLLFNFWTLRGSPKEQ